MTSRLARSLLSAAVAVLLTVGVTVGSASNAGAASSPEEVWGEARIHDLINQERARHGLAPVQRHPGAELMAQWSADVQAWVGHLGHNPNLARDVSAVVTPAWHYVGENVGCASDVDTLHRLWMNSPAHARNVLMPGVDTVGIGYRWARGCVWATVVFVDT